MTCRVRSTLRTPEGFPPWKTSGRTFSAFARPVINSPYERPARHRELEGGQPAQRVIEEKDSPVNGTSAAASGLMSHS